MLVTDPKSLKPGEYLRYQGGQGDRRVDGVVQVEETPTSANGFFVKVVEVTFKGPAAESPNFEAGKMIASGVGELYRQ